MGVVIVALVTALMIFSHRVGPVGDEMVVVLPGPDGKVGTVVVERGGEKVVLNQPYAASRIVIHRVAAAARCAVDADRLVHGALC